MTLLTRPLTLLPLLLVVCLTGCFDIGNTIKLNEDLSGTATVSMTVDMEGMVAVMAQIKKQMQGGEGDVTPEELDAARKEFVQKQEQKDEAFDEAKQKELEESLPEGVTLESMNVDQSDPLKVVVNMTFAFDHVSKLAQIEMPGDEEQAGPGPSNPINKPFEGLEVVEEGDTVTLRMKPLNPAAKPDEEEAEEGAPAAGGMMPGMDAMIEGVMSKGLAVRYRIESPFEVVEHNATDVEEGALAWNYDFAKLKAMEEEGAEDVAPHATFKR